MRLTAYRPSRASPRIVSRSDTNFIITSDASLEGFALHPHPKTEFEETESAKPINASHGQEKKKAKIVHVIT